MISQCITVRFTLFFILLFVIVACNPTTPVPSKTVSDNTPSATPPTTIPTAITPTMTPTPPPLASLPRNCPAQAMPQRKFSALGPVVGQAPIWAAGFDVPLAAIPVPTSYDTYTQYGWVWKLVWEVGPHFSQNVTLHGMNLQTGTPLHFQFDGPVTTSPVLNPQQPDHPGSAISSAYEEWGSYIYILVAGCYSLEATWAGGHWQVNFAAGRQ